MAGVTDKVQGHSKKSIRKQMFLILAVCWMIVIFLFSSREAGLSTQDSTSVGMLIGSIFIPGFDSMDPKSQNAFAAKIDYPVRKTAHAAEYAVLGLLLFGSYIDLNRRRVKAIGVPLAIGICYAGSDELHQMFVPGRSCQLTDVLIDSGGVAAGILAGLAVWMVYSRNIGQNLENIPQDML